MRCANTAGRQTQPITNARTANIKAEYPTVTTSKPVTKWNGLCLFDFVIPTSMAPSGHTLTVTRFTGSGDINYCATNRALRPPRRSHLTTLAGCRSAVYQARAIRAENFFLFSYEKAAAHAEACRT